MILFRHEDNILTAKEYLLTYSTAILRSRLLDRFEGSYKTLQMHINVEASFTHSYNPKMYYGSVFVKREELIDTLIVVYKHYVGFILS